MEAVDKFVDKGAGTIIRVLTREVIPRFRILSEISSDNGSTFTQKTVKQVLQQLRINQRFGCGYHSQSVGMVEKIMEHSKAN